MYRQYDKVIVTLFLIFEKASNLGYHLIKVRAFLEPNDKNVEHREKIRWVSVQSSTVNATKGLYQSD